MGIELRLPLLGLIFGSASQAHRQLSPEFVEVSLDIYMRLYFYIYLLPLDMCPICPLRNPLISAYQLFVDYLVALTSGVDLAESSNHEMGAKAVAVVLIVILTVINCSGVRESANVQNVLTALKFILIVLVALCAIFHTFTDSTMLSQNLSINHAFRGSNGFSGFFTSLVGKKNCISLQAFLMNPYYDFLKCTQRVCGRLMVGQILTF